MPLTDSRPRQVIADLFNASGAVGLLESVLGEGMVPPQPEGQMQVLFPPTEELTTTVGNHRH